MTQANNYPKEIQNIIKWHILDTSVREHHPEKKTINDLQKSTHFDEKIYNKLKNHISQLGQFKAPTSLFLSQKEENILD